MRSFFVTREERPLEQIGISNFGRCLFIPGVSSRLSPSWTLGRSLKINVKCGGSRFAQGNWCGREKNPADPYLNSTCLCQLNELKPRGRWTCWHPTNAVSRLQGIFVCFSQQLADVTAVIDHWSTCKWPAHDESAPFGVPWPTVSIGGFKVEIHPPLPLGVPSRCVRQSRNEKSRRITWSTVRLAPNYHPAAEENEKKFG